MSKYLLLLCFQFYFLIAISAQQHAVHNSHPYIPPADTLVKIKLDQWQDLKFGLMMHWGTYSQWGIVESWSLCPEDEGWCERRGPYKDNWYEYKKAYEGLQKTFDPVLFDPEKWANSAQKAGMKYLVFTTKHHDGFCMFDTRQTDYKITNTPFGSNPRSNIAKEVFNAFRKKDFMIGAYFSKPDWHCEDYWWPYFPPKDRNPSYHPLKYPEKWARYKQFTYLQIEELMTDYGRMDILWLDGGWVRPFNTIDTAVSWQKAIPFDQDIDMPRIARRSRELQPGLLVVDRTVTGEFENYITPEQQIPDAYLPVPWETCMTMGNSWSYVPNDQYKPAGQLIHMLCDVVSKNGSFLLNIAPGPGGDFDPAAYERLAEIGKWMDINGEAIYSTRGNDKLPVQDKMVFTHKKDTIYAIYLTGREERMPQTMKIQGLNLPSDATISLLGTSGNLKWLSSDGRIIVRIPDNIDQSKLVNYAWVLRISTHS